MARKKISGIYKIVFDCGESKRYYIGQSVDIHARIIKHLSSLRSQSHKNPIMQSVFNKYGESSFSSEVILEISSDRHVLAREEKRVYDDFVSIVGAHCMMNILTNEMTSRAGIKSSEETRKRQSEALKGRKVTGQALMNVRASAKKRIGIKLSAETIHKRTLAQKGCKRTEEWKAHMSTVMSGRVMPEEVRQKISETKKARNQKPSKEHMERLAELARNRPIDMDHIKRLAEMKIGVKRSPETIAKMVATRKANAALKGKSY